MWTGFVRTLWPLVAARFLVGLGRGLAETSERAMVADITNRTPGMLGRSLAAQQATSVLGIAIGMRYEIKDMCMAKCHRISHARITRILSPHMAKCA